MHRKRFASVLVAISWLAPVAALAHSERVERVLRRIDQISAHTSGTTREELADLREMVACIEDPESRAPVHLDTGRVISDEDFRQLVDRVIYAAVGDELRHIREASRFYYFRTPQVKRLLDVASARNEVDAAMLLYPRVVDPMHWEDVYLGTSSAANDREIQRRIDALPW